MNMIAEGFDLEPYREALATIQAGSEETRHPLADVALPDFTADTLYDVDFSRLGSLGARYLVVDAEAITSGPDESDLDKPAAEYLAENFRLYGFNAPVIVQPPGPNSMAVLKAVNLYGFDHLSTDPEPISHREQSQFWSTLLRRFDASNRPSSVASIAATYEGSVKVAAAAGLRTVLVPSSLDALEAKGLMRARVRWAQHLRASGLTVPPALQRAELEAERL